MRRDRTTDHTRGRSVLVARSKRETPTGIAGNDEDASGRPRGDPVLRELAKQSILDDRERRIDRALRALLREPLPLHIRFPEDGIMEGEDGVSQLPSICNETMLTALMTEGHPTID